MGSGGFSSNDSPSARIRGIGAHLVAGILVSIVFLVVFAKIASDVIREQLQSFDSNITSLVMAFSGPAVTQAMKVLSDFGSFAVVVPVMAIAVLFLLRRPAKTWEAFILAMAVGGAWLINLTLKSAFQRPRPDLPRLVIAGGYSFPSGHAMVSMVLYGMIGYLLWSRTRARGSRLLILVSTSLLIFLVGVSRVYLGAHYPSDVAAGFAAGGLWLTNCIVALQMVRLRTPG